MAWDSASGDFLAATGEMLACKPHARTVINGKTPSMPMLGEPDECGGAELPCGSSEMDVSTPVKSAQQRRRRDTSWADMPEQFLGLLCGTKGGGVHPGTVLRVCRKWRAALDQHQHKHCPQQVTATTRLKSGHVIQSLPKWCLNAPMLQIQFILTTHTTSKQATTTTSVVMPAAVFGPADVRELSGALRMLQNDLYGASERQGRVQARTRQGRLLGSTEGGSGRVEAGAGARQQGGLGLRVLAPGCDLSEDHVSKALAAAPRLQQMLGGQVPTLTGIYSS